MRVLQLVLLGVAMACAFADTADARIRHRAAKPAAPATPPDIPMTDPNKWCTGGFPITDDQQIRGCTFLIKNRRDKELRATAYYNRGNAFFSKGDPTTAISDYSEAIRLKEPYVEALHNRAVAYRATKNYGAAIMDYSVVLMLMPHDVAALTGRGMAYGMRGDNARAIADLSEAIAIGTSDVTARVKRGHAYLRMQRWAQALADYDQVLTTAPSNAEALFGRACAKVQSGDAKGGNVDLTQAYLLDQSILETMVAQGIGSPIVAKPNERKGIFESDEPTPAPAPPVGGQTPAPESAAPEPAAPEPVAGSDANTPPPVTNEDAGGDPPGHSWGN